MAVQVSEPMRSDQALVYCEIRKLVLNQQYPGLAFYVSPAGIDYIFIKTDKGIVAWIG